MDKTIEVGGVQYTASTLTNLNKRRVKYYMGLIGIFYRGIASDLHESENDIATVLVDYAYVSGQCKGGIALLTENDTPEVIQVKCIQWLTDGDLVALGDALTTLVNDVNPKNPDPALAPEPLPENADPKASSAVKPNRKRRGRTG